MRTAREVFSERGYERTTFREIAERIGLTRPAVNHYFPDKESLYQSLFDSARDAVIQAAVSRAGEQRTLAGQLAAFLDAATQVDSQDRSFAKFMAASVLDGFRHPQLQDSARRQIDEVRGFLRQALTAAVDRGEIPAGIDLPAVTEMLVAVLWGMGLYAGFLGTHDQLESVVAMVSRLLQGALW
jgi:AcrR family transcriptional regulator